jgi:hypothetical protein
LLYANASELHQLPTVLPVAAAVAAVILAVAAQSWINFLLRGERGLGAFLSDGTGYNKSGFQVRKKAEAALGGRTDPLPWLTLPDLDYVDVAGRPRSTDKVTFESLP